MCKLNIIKNKNYKKFLLLNNLPDLKASFV